MMKAMMKGQPLPPPAPGQSWLPSPTIKQWLYHMDGQIWSGSFVDYPYELLMTAMRDDWNHYNPVSIDFRELIEFNRGKYYWQDS